MSLNRFLGIKPAKKTEEIKTKKVEKIPLADSEEKIDPNKHALKCTKASCKFTRRVRKKILEQQDLICDRCHSPMKEVKIRMKKDKKSEEENLEGEEE